MENEQIVARLKEVQAMNLPRMSYAKAKEYGYLPSRKTVTADQLGDEITTPEGDEVTKALDEYFSKFLDPKNEFIGNGCWLCGKKQVYVSWGLAHGVAHSECCGLAYVQYHYPKLNGKEIFDTRLTMSLQYHPDTYSIDE